MEEVSAERPFVGRSGQLLNQALVTIGTSRRDFFITNATLCLPRGYYKVDPETGTRVRVSSDEAKQEALAYCRVRLLTELHVIRPIVVVPLGKLAFEAVHGVRRSIQAWRGSINATDLSTELARARDHLVRLTTPEPVT